MAAYFALGFAPGAGDVLQQVGLSLSGTALQHYCSYIIMYLILLSVASTKGSKLVCTGNSNCNIWILLPK